MKITGFTGGVTDTSAIIKYMKQGVVLEKGGCVSFTTLAELQAGVEGSSNPEREAKRVEQALGQYVVLHATKETILIYGKLWSYLDANGQRIPSNDLWTAAIAIELNIPLYGDDSHFERVPDLKYIRV